MDRALSEEGLGDVALGESRAETAIARYRDYAGIMTEAMKDFTPDDRMRRNRRLPISALATRCCASAAATKDAATWSSAQRWVRSRAAMMRAMLNQGM
jgi:hypothetical protein